MSPVLAGLLMIMIALFVYRNIIFPSNAAAVCPWSSDGWGHLMKAQYLLDQIKAGHLFPDIFPGWYNGMELLRYYAPLPYYSLVGVLAVTGNIFVAGNLFLLLCGLLGGISFLLYRKWIGLLPAFLGGILFIVLPDNLRVAFAEGNLPRVVATALLPLTFYFLLNVLLNKGRRRDIFGLAVMVMLVVLSHAMMAAVFILCMALFTLIYWLWSRASSVLIGKAVIGMLTGVLLSCWWLLPSLVGGVTEVDQVNSSEALARFPLSVSLNPFVRLGDKETFYIGLSLMLGILAVIWFCRYLSPLVKSLTLVGLLGVLLSSTIFSNLYDAIPFSYLFRPMRFLSFAGFALILGLMAFGHWLWSETKPRIRYLNRVIFVLLALIMILDFYPSIGLIFGRIAPPDMVSVADQMETTTGWRQATLDLSLLGSAPSYLFTARSDREQVFGWAYQGSATVALTSSINLALEQDYDSYTVDRLERLGVDDVVLLKDSKISSTIGSMLINQGFIKETSGTRVDYYHKDGTPRAYGMNYDLLGIGDGAYNVALLFPQMELGQSPYIDDYSLDFLDRFDRILFSRFQWHNKAKAEALITAYAAQGGRPIIDLTGTPDDVLAKEPSFLGVYGEPVDLLNQATLISNGVETPLLPFKTDNNQSWNTFTLQGLDVELETFPYTGVNGVALGYRLIDEARIDFIGLNLPFHAVLTHDPVAVKILEDELGLETGRISTHVSIPLENYTAAQDGYRFTYELEQVTEMVIPVACHDGFVLKLDGKEMPIMAMNNLIAFNAPAGRHTIYIMDHMTAMHFIGIIFSVIGVLVVLIIAIGYKCRYFIRRKDDIKKI